MHVCPGGGEDAGDDAVGGGVEVGVGEVDLGRLAAQLEGDPVDVGDGGLGHRDPGCGGAGEGDLVDLSVPGRRRSGLPGSAR